jgi:glucosyl-dolichyl phosphate glucuronosyltransferase
MNVSIIICTYNRAAMLEATMQSLVQVHDPRPMTWEVVIVDNNSKDDTPHVVRRWEVDARMRVVGVRETRQGKPFALNRGIAVAQGELLVFTDDDVQFDRSWLQRIIEPFASPNVMGVGGRIEALWPGPAPKWWSCRGPFRLHAAVVYFDMGLEPQDLTSPPFGANMAFRRRAFEQLGGFREDLGRLAGTLRGGEDTELGRRVMQAGCRVVYAPLALVRHPVEPHRARKSYFRRWYFDHGCTLARTYGPREPRVCFFGVPRYLVRTMVVAVCKALYRRWSRDGFYWELQVFEVAGLIYEFWRTRYEFPRLLVSPPSSTPRRH